MSEAIFYEFQKEVSRNRSALLEKDFRSCWGFLGLNPEFSHMGNCNDWFDTVFKFDFLKKLVSESDEDEILIHEVSQLSDEDLLYSLENIALVNKQSWNTSNPFLSTKISLNEESFRLTLIHPEITSHSRPRAFLRRHRPGAFSLEDYEHQILLSSLMEKKKNILISGSTGSGKTTLAQALLKTCSNKEHLVILEDTHEIFLENKTTTHLLSNEKNSLIDYCSYALRISPDRLILGELRGEEVLPLILAMNTGHNGFLTTIHANNAVGALQRLKTLLEFFAPKSGHCFEMVCQNIDIVVHMENKKIVEIIKVRGMNGALPLYENLFKSEKEQSYEAH